MRGGTHQPVKANLRCHSREGRGFLCGRTVSRCVCRQAHRSRIWLTVRIRQGGASHLICWWNQGNWLDLGNQKAKLHSKTIEQFLLSECSGYRRTNNDIQSYSDSLAEGLTKPLTGLRMHSYQSVYSVTVYQLNNLSMISENDQAS